MVGISMRAAVEALLQTVQSWPIAAAIRGDLPGSEWLFPIIETLHVLALALMFGSIAMLDLRLLGIGRRIGAVSALARELLPWTGIAWCAAAAFGTLLFISRAASYVHNFQFRMKLLCMALAFLNMLVFQFGAYRQVAGWDHGWPPAAARLAGMLSLMLWLGVVLFGRWVGFTS